MPCVRGCPCLALQQVGPRFRGTQQRPRVGTGDRVIAPRMASWSQPPRSVLQPFPLGLGPRVDAGHPQPARTPVDEAMRGPGRHHHHLADRSLQCLPTRREGRPTFVHHEHLLVGVAVEAGTLTRWKIGQQQADRRPVLPAPKPEVSRALASQFVPANDAPYTPPLRAILPTSCPAILAQEQEKQRLAPPPTCPRGATGPPPRTS